MNSYGNEAVLGDERYHSQPGNHYQENADFHKHFYAFEAPYDSVEEVDLAETKLSSLAQKNLQVVFIKAPENKAVVGALNALAKQTSEDKTAIYVLNKQTDVNELASQLSALKAHHKHKPQVHFVKYKTEEEAAQAQQYIQAQYGGGSSIPQPAKASSLGYYLSSSHSMSRMPHLKSIQLAKRVICHPLNSPPISRSPDICHPCPVTPPFHRAIMLLDLQLESPPLDRSICHLFPRLSRI